MLAGKLHRGPKPSLGVPQSHRHACGGRSVIARHTEGSRGFSCGAISSRCPLFIARAIPPRLFTPGNRAALDDLTIGCR
jgi:hypothetical protein